MVDGVGWQACLGTHPAQGAFPEPSWGPKHVHLPCLDGGMFCPLFLQFWVDFGFWTLLSLFLLPAKKFCPRARFLLNWAKTARREFNNFSLLDSCPVAFQKLISLPWVLWYMVIDLSSAHCLVLQPSSKITYILSALVSSLENGNNNFNQVAMMIEQDNICKASDSATLNKCYLLLLSQVFYLASITSAICLLVYEPTHVIKKCKWNHCSTLTFFFP